ncbi:unnamed protein product [Cylindrotheca closterium]|uniref:RING-type domain-containing protein n=1 Tax=Cylindrotheca closterium TaxID=2856 RepID=A0AAD2CWR2_9STRA|nr:unnamed protein product [Cylindrotheca closterium]
MVVPNIRNPNRYRTLQVATSTKSQYHLEPDHAFAYRHVGRRTKGGRGGGPGGGGGFLYSSGADRSNRVHNGGGRVVVILIALLTVCAVLNMIGCACRKSGNTRSANHANQGDIHATRDPIYRQRNQSGNSNAPSNDTVSSANVIRFHTSPNVNKSPSGGNPVSHITIMKTNFYFRTVLPENSNIDRNVLSEEAKMGVTARDEDGVVKDGDPTGKGGANKDEGAMKNTSISSRFLSMSPWRRLTAMDECSICLQPYKYGQTICVAKNTHCKHVFHQDCIEEWLKDHSNCPLCRVTLVYKPL